MSKPNTVAWQQDCARFAGPDRVACEREQASQERKAPPGADGAAKSSQ